MNLFIMCLQDLQILWMSWKVQEKYSLHQQMWILRSLPRVWENSKSQRFAKTPIGPYWISQYTWDHHEEKYERLRQKEDEFNDSIMKVLFFLT